jgi:hypothetical protein
MNQNSKHDTVMKSDRNTASLASGRGGSSANTVAIYVL